MAREIEVTLPKNWGKGMLKSLLLIFCSIGLMAIGYLVSPKSEEGRPPILSPRLAQVKQYQDWTKGLVSDLERVDVILSSLLAIDVSDLFVQSDKANQATGEVVRVLEEIDRTGVPQTLEQLQALVFDAATSYEVAAEKTSIWIGEPTEANYIAANDALLQGRAALERAKNNPWIASTGEDGNQ